MLCVVRCDKKGAGVRHNVRGSVGLITHELENRSVTLLRSDNTPHVNTCSRELHKATLDAQVLHSEQIARRLLTAIFTNVGYFCKTTLKLVKI